MTAVLAFFGMLLVSLIVGVLAALQLGDFFRAGDELPVVIVAIVAFASVSIAVFATAYVRVKQAHALNAVAFGLAIVATGMALWPGTLTRIAERSTNPYTVATERTYIALELLIPALLLVLVQWGLVRRRWLIVAGEEDVTVWPWLTTALAGLGILNPIGLAFFWAAIRQSPTDWLREVATLVAATAVAAVVVMAAIECYIRERIRRRRLGQSRP
jgi:hypothetical protein